VEHNGERTLYVVTDKLPMAKDLVAKGQARKNGLNAGYALRPSHFWMPQVG
jgi:hypothetical protein